MNKNRHLISRYLCGELDFQEAARFEEILSSDMDLQKEMKLYQDVDKAVQDTEVLNLRLQLESIHSEMLHQPARGIRPAHRRLLRYAAVAASIAVIVGIGIGLFQESSLTERFYRPYNVTMVNRSSEMSVDFTLREAMKKYENKEYKEAVILFERVIAAEPDMLSNFLYSGISYMEIKEYNHAEKSFQCIIDHKDNLYVEQADWYIGFCYLLTDRREKAYKHFNKLANENGYFSEKAKEILKKLN
jgi:tetratricopeptide (TPR) repeat protein